MGNYSLYADRYGDDLNRKYSTISSTLTVNKDNNNNYKNTYVNAFAQRGTSSSDRNTIETLSVMNYSPFQKGFNVVFSLAGNMEFGNGSDGFNGMVSFAWSSISLGSNTGSAIPAKLIYSSYKPTEEDIETINSGGGLGTSLWQIPTSNCGVTLTLYPDKNGDTSDSHTTFTHYRLCIKKQCNCDVSTHNTPVIHNTNENVIVYEDDLPVAIDAFDHTSLTITERDELGYNNILLNGINIVSFYLEHSEDDIHSTTCDLAQLQNSYFSVSAMGGLSSHAEIELYSINGVSAAFCGDISGILENMYDQLISAQLLTTDDEQFVSEIINAYPSDSEQLGILAHNNDMLNALDNWYYNH